MTTHEQWYLQEPKLKGLCSDILNKKCKVASERAWLVAFALGECSTAPENQSAFPYFTEQAELNDFLQAIVDDIHNAVRVRIVGNCVVQLTTKHKTAVIPLSLIGENIENPLELVALLTQVEL